MQFLDVPFQEFHRLKSLNFAGQTQIALLEERSEYLPDHLDAFLSRKRD
jgi:hypothetical protein